jgi:hypothetical protein
MFKKILIAIMLYATFSLAKPLVLEICKPTFCYLQIIPDARSWAWTTDFNGNKFVRVYLDGKRLLDITGSNLTVKVKK